jgi:hypothetical protein
MISVSFFGVIEFLVRRSSDKICPTVMALGNTLSNHVKLVFAYLEAIRFTRPG